MGIGACTEEEVAACPIFLGQAVEKLDQLWFAHRMADANRAIHPEALRNLIKQVFNPLAPDFAQHRYAFGGRGRDISHLLFILRPLPLYNPRIPQR